MKEDIPTVEAFRHSEGRLGVRSHVVVLPTTINTSPIADAIAAPRDRVVSLAHDHGCSQLGADAALTRNILTGLGWHPNAAGTVVVGSDRGGTAVTDLCEPLALVPTRRVSMWAAGGAHNCIEAGGTAADELLSQCSPRREPVGIDELVVGLVASDLEQSTIRTVHPLIAKMTTELVHHGARVLAAGVDRLLPFHDETSEAIEDQDSVERLFARMADVPPRNRQIGIRARASGFENVISFLGDTRIDRVMVCGETLDPGPGVTILDAPSRFEEATTALAAAGAHLVVHLTAHGAPSGHPVVPVLTISGDSDTLAAIPGDIDLNAQAADAANVLSAIHRVAGGTRTAAERNGFTTVSIPRIGPSL